MRVRFEQIDGDSVLFGVDLRIYSVTALQKVVHRFTDRCHVHLQSGEEVVEVRMRAKDNLVASTLSGEFCNELLDQTLRESLADESRAERDLILAHALSRTRLIAPTVRATASAEETPQVQQ